jgi:hypothetical protein
LELLKEKQIQGILHFNTRWRDFLPTIRGDKRYLEMVSPNQSGLGKKKKNFYSFFFFFAEVYLENFSVIF